MYLMYVDDSGTSDINDDTKFFVTDGAIIHENDLNSMKDDIQNYKDVEFTGQLQGAEIHVYDIYKEKKAFAGIPLSKRTDLLQKLYSIINKIPMTTIVIGIDKQKFIRRHSDPDEILDYGYMLLVERFDNFLNDKNDNGIIRIDRSTDIHQPFLNSLDTRVLKIINKVRKRGTRWQSAATSIVEEPLFLPSHCRKGIQIADAVAYCSTRHVNGHTNFEVYWKVISSKLRTGPNGQVIGYGYRIYPR